MTREHWSSERLDDGVVVVGYRNDPMNYFVADGAAEFAELVGEWADPSVRAVVFFASDEASYCTGSVLLVDGGCTARSFPG